MDLFPGSTLSRNSVSLCFIVFLLSISFSESLTCKGSAKYKLTFKGEWTEVSHPQDFPTGKFPHFSSVVGCSHASSYVMWRPGMIATTGVKLVAEIGTTGDLNNEIDKQISLKAALDRFSGGGIPNIGTRVVSDIRVNTDYPLVSAISMIFPSPDWFVGVRDYSLCNDTTGKWIDKRVRDLPLYDSGTDSAKSFVHTDTPTNPPIPIFLITSIPEGSSSIEKLKTFGTFTFEKTFDSTEGNPPAGQTTATPTNVAFRHAFVDILMFIKLMILSLFIAYY